MQSPAGVKVTFIPVNSSMTAALQCRCGVTVRVTNEPPLPSHRQQQLIRKMFIHGRARREIGARALHRLVGHRFRWYALLAKSREYFGHVLMLERDGHRIPRPCVVGQSLQQQIALREPQSAADDFELTLRDVQRNRGDIGFGVAAHQRAARGQRKRA